MSRCRHDLVLIMQLTALAQPSLSAQRALSAHVAPPSRTRRTAHCTATRPLTVISFLSPCPSPTTYNMSGAGAVAACAERYSKGWHIDVTSTKRLGATKQDVKTRKTLGQQPAPIDPRNVSARTSMPSPHTCARRQARPCNTLEGQ